MQFPVHRRRQFGLLIEGRLRSQWYSRALKRALDLRDHVAALASRERLLNQFLHLDHAPNIEKHSKLALEQLLAMKGNDEFRQRSNFAGQMMRRLFTAERLGTYTFLQELSDIVEEIYG